VRDDAHETAGETPAFRITDPHERSADALVGRFGFEPAAPRVVSPPDTHYLVIIDDEDHIREVAALSLEMTEGWRVEAVNSGALGLSLVRTSQPDAVLLDVMMPEMDGPSCLLELRADPSTREIPVIFLTAKVHAGDLRKPFDPIALGTQIRNVLSW
jgi:CheY-like chemotaxis protein